MVNEKANLQEKTVKPYLNLISKVIPKKLVWITVFAVIFHELFLGGFSYQGSQIAILPYERSGYNKEVTNLIYAEKYDEAEQLLQSVLEDKTIPIGNGDRGIIYENLALIYERKREFDKSIEHYQKAMSFYPLHTGKYYSTSGKIEILKGDIERAIGEFEKALQLDPHEDSANNMLGLIFLGRYGVAYRDPEKALAYNEKVNSLLRDEATKFNLATNHYELGQYGKALFFLESLRRESPSNPLVKYYLGLTYLKVCRIEKGKEFIEEARKSKPSLPSVKYPSLEACLKLWERP